MTGGKFCNKLHMAKVLAKRRHVAGMLRKINKTKYMVKARIAGMLMQPIKEF